LFFFLFCYCSGDLLDLHSFPTRRSSDLEAVVAVICRVAVVAVVAVQVEELIALVIVQVEELIVLVIVPVVALTVLVVEADTMVEDRKSTRLNSSHLVISYAVFCLKKKKK